MTVRLCSLALVALLFAGCDTDSTSLFDPDLQARPDPVLSNAEPDATANIVLAGIDEVTLTGQNFSTTPSDNLVYFNNARAEVLSATETQLVVRAPNVPGDDLDLRVAVLGAENYSASLSYALVSALAEVSAVAPSEQPTGMGADDAGNLYVSLQAEGAPTGIFEITPDGMRSLYYDGTLFPWSDLEVAPNGDVIGARGIRALFRLPEGGTQETYQVMSGSPSPTIRSIEFDDAGGLWAGSGTGALFYVPPGGGSFETFEVQGAVRDVVLFDGALYAAIVDNGVGRIARFPLAGAGSLGAEETYFTFDAGLNATPRALAFAENGTLFVGTNFIDASQSFRDPIFAIDTDRNAQPLYTGVLGPQEGGERVRIDGFAWGPETGLYAIRAFITGAGSEDDPIVERGDLVRIETRIQGS